MRRELISALLASAASTIWAIRPELIAEAKATLLSGAPMRGLALGLDKLIGQDLTEPVGFGPVEAAEGAGDPQAAIHPATERASARKAGGVAVIPVRGTLSPRVTIFDLLFGTGVTPPAWIVQQARQAVADDSIKTVIIDWDCPGGNVIGCHEAASALFAMRGKKPIVSQVSGVMASAAYWIGCSADEIVATETAVVGSLGVFMEHDDFSKMYDDLGVKVTYVASNPEKVETQDSAPLTPEALAHLEEMVGDYWSMFVSAVAKGRGVPEATVRGPEFGKGRAFVAARGQARGLVDKVRGLNDTLLAYGVDPGQPQPDMTSRRGRGIALLRREIEALDL